MHREGYRDQASRPLRSYDFTLQTDSTDYVQNVVVEYNQLIINSLDQVIAFNCSVSKTVGPDFTSASAMSVTILK